MLSVLTKNNEQLIEKRRYEFNAFINAKSVRWRWHDNMRRFTILMNDEKKWMSLVYDKISKTCEMTFAQWE